VRPRASADLTLRILARGGDIGGQEERTYFVASREDRGQGPVDRKGYSVASEKVGSVGSDPGSKQEEVAESRAPVIDSRGCGVAAFVRKVLLNTIPKRETWLVIISAEPAAERSVPFAAW
jgi:hypothetical protein